MSNAEIAARLEQLSELLRHGGRGEGGGGGGGEENRYKARAYRNAARGVRTFSERVSDLASRGEALTRIPGVGKGISAAILELLASGELPRAAALGKGVPSGAAEIAGAFRIPIRDATRVMKTLGVGSVAELRDRLSSDGVGAIGARMEAVLRGRMEGESRRLWYSVGEMVEGLRAFLAAVPGVSRVEAAGSYRRGRETVGTIRFVVHGADDEAVRTSMRGHAGLEGVGVAEDGAVTARVDGGVTLRVRLASEEDWGDALVEETGSPAHLKEVARHAGRRRRGRAETEEAWYGARGLEWIPPELREGRGEVEAAAAGLVPQLVTIERIRGDLHMHTTASDGANTIAEMVRAARARGYQYIAITDHSQSLKITNGLDEKRLRKQMAEIDRLNARLKGFRVLKGSEVDILKDGSLDFPDSVLRDLDVVICSVHSRFATPKAAQTERIIRAIENPYVTCVGHLTGRLLLKRPGYELDVDRVLRAVKANGKALEINSSPDRLDISDETAMRARGMGIPLVINTDAHSVRELDFMRLGVQQARRGWQSAETVLNTLTLAGFLKWKSRQRRGARA